MSELRDVLAVAGAEIARYREMLGESGVAPRATRSEIVMVLEQPLPAEGAPLGAGNWIPPMLANVVSGVSNEVAVLVAIAALVLWAGVPATTGLVSTAKREVV